MKAKVRLLLLWLAIIPLGSKAQGIDDIMSSLKSMSPFSSKAVIEILTPGAVEPVTKNITLFCSNLLGNDYSPSSFIIDYESEKPKVKDGFVAFTDSCLYRFDGEVFSEYTPQRKNLSKSSVHGAMFAELLPSSILAEIESALDDENKCVEVANEGPDRIDVVISTRYNDSVVARKMYRFSLPSLALMGMTSESNIGGPGETSLTATYLSGAQKPRVVDSAFILDRHGDIINLFASDKVVPENYIGYAMPRFTLPDFKGGRFTFRPGHESLIVFVDNSADEYAVEEIASDVRYAYSLHPMGNSMNTIYIILSRYVDAMPASVAPSGHETRLLGGARLAEEIGATSFPLLMMVNEEGRVMDVAAGVNKDLPEIVIKMLNK